MGDKDKGASAPTAPRKPRERKISLRNLTRPKTKPAEQPPPLPATASSSSSNAGRRSSPVAPTPLDAHQMPRSSHVEPAGLSAAKEHNPAQPSSSSSKSPTNGSSAGSVISSSISADSIISNNQNNNNTTLAPSASSKESLHHAASASSNHSIAGTHAAESTSSSRSPPNAWLSRSGTSSNRNRSGSVGSNEPSPRRSTSAQPITLSRSTSSASNLQSPTSPMTSSGLSQPQSERRKSHTWRRIISGSAAKSDSRDRTLVPDTPVSPTSRASRSQRSSVFEAFRDAPDARWDEAVGTSPSEAVRATSPLRTEKRQAASPRLHSRKSFVPRSGASADSDLPSSPQLPQKAHHGPMRTLRRMSSKPLLSNQYQERSNSNASRESLVSVARSEQNSSIHAAASFSTAGVGMARRASNAMERALPGWLSGNKEKAVESPALARRESDSSSNGASQGWTDTGQGLRPKLKPSSESLSSRRSDRTSNQLRKASVSTNGLQVPSSADVTADSEIETLTDTNEGIPKRLSGWLLNMITNDSPSSRQPSAYDPSRDVTPAGTPGPRASASSVENTPLSQKTSISSLTNSTVASKARSPGGLLSNFSASARARAAAAAAMGSSGFDKALCYLSEDAPAEDIWLLGVKHSMSDGAASHSTPLGPAIEVISPSPAKTSAAASPNGRHESLRETTLSSDGTQFSGAVIADRRLRETAPSSTHTASTIDSASHESNGSGWHSASYARPRKDEARTKQHSVSSSSASAKSADSKSSGKDSSRSQVAASRRISVETGNSDVHTSAQQRRSQIPYATPTVLSRQTDFQSDFSSRVWCSYRSNFVPISRDGSISKEAEAAAAMVAASLSNATQQRNALAVMPESAVSSQSEDPRSAPGTPSGNQRGWLARRAGDASASGTPSGQYRSPSLGNAMGVSPAPSPGPPANGTSLSEKMGIPNFWGRATAAVQAVGLTGRSGLTTDAGWGCMLRTGQSLLANALIDVHLGREWQRGARPLPSSEAPADPQEYETWKELRASYATYVRILSWFFDEPSVACPFGIHRMAREGKRLGKEVGEWFGPSTAAGAIKKLADDFEEAGIGVSVATDGVVYLSDVHQAAAGAQRNKVTSRKQTSKAWRRPVVILIGIRLGLEGVNPMYYESIQQLFTFPQTLGIAGGRPSSSYYFVGYQGNSLFYLDPHNVRPAVPFKHPPPSQQQQSTPSSRSFQDQDNLDEWWTHVYTESELSTFHCDRPKRMPMRSLDPSMLLGFLVKDEASMTDLTNRVRSLPKSIFAIQSEPPKWMRDSDGGDFDGSGEENDPSLESFSESSQLGEADDRDEIDDLRSQGPASSGIAMGASPSAENAIVSPPETPILDESSANTGQSRVLDERSVGLSGSQEVPGIHISSASSGSILAHHQFPVRRSRDNSSLIAKDNAHDRRHPSRPSFPGADSHADTTDPTMTESSPTPHFLRYHSDVRFPSTGSNATARQYSGASTNRQASDSYIAVEEEDSDGDLVACHTESSASASVSPDSVLESGSSNTGKPEPLDADYENDADLGAGMANSQVHGLAIRMPIAGSPQQAHHSTSHTAQSSEGGGPASTSWEEVSAHEPTMSSSPTTGGWSHRQQASVSSEAESSSLYHSAYGTGCIPRSNRIDFRPLHEAAGTDVSHQHSSHKAKYGFSAGRNVQSSSSIQQHHNDDGDDDVADSSTGSVRRWPSVEGNLGDQSYDRVGSDDLSHFQRTDHVKASPPRR